ncbi:glycosyltransferase [Streptomyces sp. NPDC005648]|uniref:glycosyltransferase n=1 Tax=Streptomyces sp. NPDC005648 TaxID=3157044 RepID=UPI0033A4D325
MRNATLATGSWRSDGRAPSWPATPAQVAPAATLPTPPVLPRIKVLHVITRFEAGAGGNTLLSAEGMDPERYEVWIAGVPGGEFWERARAAGLHTVQIPGFRHTLTPTDLLVLRRLVRLIRHERFTVVHTHSGKGGFLGRTAARWCRTPVVVHTFHGFSFHPYMSRGRRTAYRWLERATRRFTHRFLAVAPRVAQEAVEERLATPGRIHVVPSAVDLGHIPERFDPTARRALGVPPETALVGTVGRVDHQKAPWNFVRMAAAIRAERPGSAFVMIGDGPLLDETRKLAAELDIDVIFTGHRADASWLVAGLDVFVTTSLYEGLGRALTEALATARPVVATAVNGVPDLVEHGATGLLVPPADPQEEARAVGWLLDHPREAAEMGRQGRRRVRTSFEPQAMCAAVDACYRELLGLPPLPEPSAGVPGRHRGIVPAP